MDDACGDFGKCLGANKKYRNIFFLGMRVNSGWIAGFYDGIFNNYQYENLSMSNRMQSVAIEGHWASKQI